MAGKPDLWEGNNYEFDGRLVATTETNQAAADSTLRAIVQDSYGSAAVLRPAQIDRAEIEGPGARPDPAARMLSNNSPHQPVKESA